MVVVVVAKMFVCDERKLGVRRRRYLYLSELGLTARSRNTCCSRSSSLFPAFVSYDVLSDVAPPMPPRAVELAQSWNKPNSLFDGGATHDVAAIRIEFRHRWLSAARKVSSFIAWK